MNEMKHGAMPPLENLAPAGNREALDRAAAAGADAVYLGYAAFSARAGAGNFDEDALREAVALTHAAGKKFYLTMNVYPFDDELEAFVEAAQYAHSVGVDAAIVSDLGAISILRERVPELPIHVSTQASTVNTAAIRHYRQMGCTRVILAREVSIDRMARMNEQLNGEIELEK